MKKNIARCSFFAALLVICFSIDFAEESPQRISFVHDVQARVGAPWAPVSVAGTTRRVARRTARRTTSAVAGTAAYAGAAAASDAATSVLPTSTVIAKEAPPAEPTAATGTAIPVGAIISALPEGCKSVVNAGATYFNCAGVYYKPAFQGSTLVYMAVDKPL